MRTLKSISILAGTLALAGCFETTKVIAEATPVSVPVAVPCTHEVPKEPVWLLDAPDMRKADMFVRGNTALREIEQRRAYIRELRAALSACVGPPP